VVIRCIRHIVVVSCVGDDVSGDMPIIDYAREQWRTQKISERGPSFVTTV